MTRFVSYAQNYEDVILWRALQHIENGFYVDCGAYDPDRDSVTRAFYQRGWRGINIEPLPHLLPSFLARRPLDINLSVALSDNSDGTRFYEVADTGLSTVMLNLARRHVNDGFLVRRTDVPTRTLSDVLGEFLPEAIHFLKIDVEGAESLVLRGTDLEKFRPWVILIEATLPRSSEPSIDWEASLLAHGYAFAYFDGLNRFYVANEHAELSEALAVPPNVFDNYIQNVHLEAIEAAERALAQIRQSTPWLLTVGLRKARTALRMLRADPRQFFVHIARYLPGLRAPAIRLVQVKQLYELRARFTTLFPHRRLAGCCVQGRSFDSPS
jgi:FkbM family methyltransferase